MVPGESLGQGRFPNLPSEKHSPLPESARERAALRSTVMRQLDDKRQAERAAGDALLAEEMRLEDIERYVERIHPTVRWHGSMTGYTHHGCRCALCKAAKHRYSQKRWAEGKK